MTAALREVVVDYPARGRALGPFSLTVAPGEIVAIVGPSGCGKSTALRLLAGLEQPTSGAVERQVGRGKTALVFQSPTMMPWADAATNVALPLKLAELPAVERDERVARALRRVGLADAAKAYPAELSGGMAMRVSLARALVTEPRLLLLDEPFAALDGLTRRRLVEDVHRLWEQAMPAIVFVTHDVDEAVYLASRVVILTACPGWRTAEVAVEAAIPRPAGFRASEAFRNAVEDVTAALETGVEAVA